MIDNDQPSPEAAPITEEKLAEAKDVFSAKIMQNDTVFRMVAPLLEGKERFPDFLCEPVIRPDEHAGTADVGLILGFSSPDEGRNEHLNIGTLGMKEEGHDKPDGGFEVAAMAVGIDDVDGAFEEVAAAWTEAWDEMGSVVGNAGVMIGSDGAVHVPFGPVSGPPPFGSVRRID